VDIRDTATFYNKVREYRHDLRDFAEDKKEVVQFFEHQRPIFNDAYEKLDIFKRNETFITDSTVQETAEQIENIIRHVSPYRNIRSLPALTQQFNEQYLALIEAECQPVLRTVE